MLTSGVAGGEALAVVIVQLHTRAGVLLGSGRQTKPPRCQECSGGDKEHLHDRVGRVKEQIYNIGVLAWSCIDLNRSELIILTAFEKPS